MGDGSSKNPFGSLECAVNNSKNGSKIYLNAGEYVGDNNRNIKIDKSITIIGKSKQNTIINAEKCGRLFDVTSTGRLTLIDITLKNGYLTGNGGLIYNDGGVINIKNCILKNSSAYGNGGVIYNNMGTLNIENSFFINNSARYYGGVLYTLGTTSLKNSNFTENVLISKEGVGACIASGGKIDLDGCYFYKCYTAYSAAALLNLGNATINNCRFERLTTNYTAGAISNHKYMIINNSYFGYNDVKYYAAAILAPPSGQHVITEVYNTIFEKNHAGYHASVSNNYKDTELYMQNCALIDNYIKLNYAYGDISLDDNATVQYCWWGQNEISPYYYSPHSGEIEPEKINASRWLVMTFTSNNNVIYKNEVNQLTVSLKHYFDNETKEIYEYDDEFNLPLDVTFYTNLGTLATKKLVNGVATLDYTPQNGVKAVYAKINNQILKIDNFKMLDPIVNESGEIEPEKINDSSWLVMAFTSNNNVIYRNEINQLNFSLKHYYFDNETKEIREYDDEFNLPLEVTFYTNLGTLATKKLVNGVATLDYNPENGVNAVYAKIKDKTLKIDNFQLRKTKIIVNNFEKYYGSSEKLTIKLAKENNAPISNEKLTVILAGNKYTAKTDKNGIAKLSLKNSPNTYTVKITFNGNNYIGSSKSIKVKIVKPIIKASNLKVHKKGNFIVTFKDAHNKAIKNTKVKFKINGKTYIRTTNSNGQAKLAINLKVGKKYAVKVGFENTEKYGTTTLTKTIKVIK